MINLIEMLKIFVMASLTSLADSATGPIVSTAGGSVLGKYLKVTVREDHRPTTVSTFLGIPFARPPLGDLRFASPQPPLSWEPDIREATEFGPACIHNDDTVFTGFPGAEVWNSPNHKSEDCLHLNVWTPIVRFKSAKPLAVMVWIFGGSFFSGTPAVPFYDGRYLAASESLVVVSLNYRLGPLGFLPPMAGETVGNAGLYDQQMALKWVRDNIKEFGGNPNNVTLFGESAGAVSASLHSVAPSSRGLFNRIILQSGNQLTPWSTITLEKSLERTRNMSSFLGCPNPYTASEASLLRCLRERSALDVFSNSWVSTDIFDFPFVPVAGTDFLPRSTLEITLQGQQADVDILLGYNSNEGSYFTIYAVEGFNKSTESLITRDQYINGLEVCGLRTSTLGRAAVSFMYSDWENPTSLTQYREALDNIVGDYHVVCPTIRTAKLHSQAFSNRKVFVYHLNYRISTNPWPIWMGVMHGYEIELVFGLPMFGNFKYANNYSDADREVSRRMVRYWSNFAKFGNPNGHEVDKPNEPTDQQAWPQFNVPEQAFFEINENNDVKRRVTSYNKICAFWEVYLPSLVLATANVGEVEAQWKVQFQRWTESMDNWDRAFQSYSESKNDETGCSD